MIAQDVVVDGEDDDDKDSDNDNDNDDDDYFALSISHCVTIMFCLSNSMVKPRMWLSTSISRCRSFICSLALNRSVFGSKSKKTRQSKQCGFSIYTFDNFKSKSMVSLVRAEKMVLSGLVFARKIARMILIQNI